MSGGTLPPIKTFADASKQVLHGDETTQGTKCHGCYSMEIIKGNKKIKPKRYWCESLHREIDPHNVRCPLTNKPKVKRKKVKPMFNNREVGKKANKRK